jgi:hypothetical protein
MHCGQVLCAVRHALYVFYTAHVRCSLLFRIWTPYEICKIFQSKTTAQREINVRIRVIKCRTAGLKSACIPTVLRPVNSITSFHGFAHPNAALLALVSEFPSNLLHILLNVFLLLITESTSRRFILSATYSCFARTSGHSLETSTAGSVSFPL